MKHRTIALALLAAMHVSSVSEAKPTTPQLEESEDQGGPSEENKTEKTLKFLWKAAKFFHKHGWKRKSSTISEFDLRMTDANAIKVDLQISCGYYRDWRRRKIQRFPKSFDLYVNGRRIDHRTWNERPASGKRERTFTVEVGKVFNEAELNSAAALGETELVARVKAHAVCLDHKKGKWRNRPANANAEGELRVPTSK